MADRATSTRRTGERRPDPPFASFCEAVRALLDETAADKGYQQAGLTGPNPLYALVSDMAGGPGHALGEIIYKVAPVCGTPQPGGSRESRGVGLSHLALRSTGRPVP